MNRLLMVLRLVGWVSLAIATFRLGLVDLRPMGNQPPKGDPIVLLDCVYRVADGRAARLDVYLPAPHSAGEGDGSGPRRPAILLIHGGSWVGGSKSEYAAPFMRLLDHGYVLFAAEYCLARPGAPGWPGALLDLKEAVRWIRRNAAALGVDPARLVALGSGAGGHLAMLLGADASADRPEEALARVQAVVSLYGPSDLTDLVRRRNLPHEPALVFLGDERTRGEAASPIHLLGPRSAPALLFHGTEDAWVPPEQSLRLAERLAAHSVPHRLVLIPGARHGFSLQVMHPENRDLQPELLSFLEMIWGLQETRVP